MKRATSRPASGSLATASGHYESSQYPARLSMYYNPPLFEITIDEFEESALHRLELLRCVETATIRNLKDDELGNFLGKSADRLLPLHANASAAAYALEEERKADHISHFVLRLAFCANPERMKWLVAHECALFKWRFLNETPLERSEFIKKNINDFVLLSPVEKERIAESLIRGTPAIKDVRNEEFFRVPFEQVPDLVGRRAVFLENGSAYVPKSESLSILMTRFRENLEMALDQTARAFPNIREDRLIPLLDQIRKAETSTDSISEPLDGRLSAGDIDKASTHFPLCMQSLHLHLRNDSHLKYGGRQQYGLFLKAIGLSLEEAMAFWKGSFASKYNEDAFNKAYAYNIRHNYGKEGKRAAYTQYGCMKTINSNAPGPGDHHGCPFRHSSAENLAVSLSQYRAPGGNKLTPAQVKEIMEMVKNRHYQLACTRMFEFSRGLDAPMETITWPSRFYEASLALKSSGIETKKENSSSSRNTISVNKTK